MFAGLFVPAAWIVYLAATGALEPKVVTEMIHRTGQWTIRFLTLSLLVTPLMRGARYPKLVAIRRMVGVAAFAYACAHLTLYVVDQHFDLAHVASEIALRFYLTIGFVAWLGLAALAATSTDAMIRRLGQQVADPAFARLRDRRARAAAFHDPGEGRRVGAGDDDRLLPDPDAVPRLGETRPAGLGRRRSPRRSSRRP